MRERSRAIAQWTVPAFIVLAMVVDIATASAQNQPADLPELPAPVRRTYDVAAFVEGKSLPSGFSGRNTAIHSFSYIDLTTEDLSLHQEKGTGSNSDLEVINLPESTGDTFGNSPSMVFSTARPAPEAKVQWTAAIQESLFLIGIGHTFDLATEAGSRDALLNGPWLKDYLHSVGELRGWSDSDRFMAPYASHPIQGSAFGFIERQNDPRYRNVQWGDGREYFMSPLHSMAYAAIWHTEWKIGPASEASIGNVMLHASPGFICLVDTATLGTIAMMAEDIADRYLVKGD